MLWNKTYKEVSKKSKPKPRVVKSVRNHKRGLQLRLFEEYHELSELYDCVMGPVYEKIYRLVLWRKDLLTEHHFTWTEELEVIGDLEYCERYYGELERTYLLDVFGK